MAWIVVATSIEQVDALLAQLDGAPDGMEERYIGTADDGELRVVSLWQSKAHAHRFFAEQLGPAVAKALGPEPVGTSEIVGIDVQRSYVRQPVAGDATPADGRTKMVTAGVDVGVGRPERPWSFSWPRWR